MGRRPNAAKSKQGAQTKPERGVEMPLQGTNPSLEGAELQPQNTNQTLERIELQQKQANSGNLSSKRKGKHAVSVSVRRSLRLQDAVVRTHKQDIERVIEEIALSESEKEDEPPAYENAEQPNPTLEDGNLEDKIDYLVQLVEKQQRRFSTSEGSSLSLARYKSFYVDSQKKIETLTEENRQLAMKLENALGKLEAYEKGTHAYSEMLEKLKDVILVSNLTKATENAVNISSQAVHDAYTSMDAGREPKTLSAKRRKLNHKKRKN